MRIVKGHLSSVLMGVLAMGGIAFFGAQQLTPSQDIALTRAASQTAGAEERNGQHGRHRLRHGMHRAIRGELVVPGDEEGTFRTVRIDRGVIERIDGSTVVIEEDDGTTVEVPTSSETRIRRDREEASVSDLRAGDHVRALRADSGDGLETRALLASSEERWQELQERHEQCRENREHCRMERRERRGSREGAPPAGGPSESGLAESVPA